MNSCTELASHTSRFSYLCCHTGIRVVIDYLWYMVGWKDLVWRENQQKITGLGETPLRREIDSEVALSW